MRCSSAGRSTRSSALPRCACCSWKHGVEPVAPPAAFDRVAPHQHGGHLVQLCRHLVGEVVVVDGRLGGDTGRLEGVEQRGESARGAVGRIARGPVAGIQQRNAARHDGTHRAQSCGLSASGRPAACHASMPPSR
jgi:hypothetical protein